MVLAPFVGRGIIENVVFAVSYSYVLKNPNYRYVFAILVVVVFSLLNLSHLRGGVSLSMDSLHYLLGAKNMAQGFGYSIPDYSSVSSTMHAITIWPIGYSAILSLGCVGNSCSQESIETFARGLNVVMALTVFMLVYATVRRNNGVVVSVLTSMVVGLTPILQIVFMYVWSEIVFIPLVLAAFYCVRLYLDSDSQKHKLYVAVLLLICATYVRYVGLSFAIALTFTVFFYDQASISERIRKSATSFIVYIIGVAPLLISNYVTSGYVSGAERGMPSSRVVNDIGQLFSIYSQEFFWGYALASGLFLGFYLVILIYLNMRERAANRDISVLVNLPLLWLGLYVSFLLVSREIQNIDLDARMMSVVWPMFIYSVIGVLTAGDGNGTVLVRRLMVFFMFLFVLTSGVGANSLLLKNVATSKEIGYVNGMYYPSLSGPQLKYMRTAIDSIRPICSEWIMTDFERPIVIDYLTGCNKIFQLQNNKLDVLHDGIKGLRGWVILTRKDNMLSAMSDPQYSGNMYFVKNDSGKVVYVLIRRA